MGIASPSSNNKRNNAADTGIRQVGAAIVFVVVFWLLSAAIAAVSSPTQRFFSFLFEPSAHEKVEMILILLLAGCLIRYYSQASKEKESLEAALQEAVVKAEEEREKVVGIMEAVADAISIQDPQLKVLYQNKAHQELIGAHVGEPCYKAYRNSDRVCPDCHLAAALDDGLVHRVELQRDQQERWVEIIASPLKDQSGRIIAGIEVVRDITDRKAAEQASKKEAALLQHLIDTIPNPIYYQDLSGRFVWCNTAFAGWLGKGRELLIGRTIDEVAPEAVSHAFAKKEPVQDRGAVYESSLQRPDGEVRDVIFYKSKFGDTGDGGGVVGVIVDITDRKRSEEKIVGLNAALTQQALEMQQANRELEAFSHAISHDLRTPLTRIYTSGQALLEYEDALDENGVFFVKSVNEGCIQIEGLLDALLVLSKVTEVDLVSDHVDLTQLAHEKAAQLRQGQPERQVSFRIAPKLRVKGDHNLLHIALENLLANAWKYTSHSDDPLIEVGSFISSEGETVYFVKDNGAGFDSDHADQLFKPFRRLHSTHQFPGTGLGLATVRRIIRRHGGRVWGEGELGCGATFYFTINP